ncbi:MULTISPECIES: amidohydrolase family protein [Arthrobacter]|uniref:Amidohydrolase family protein n=2 Tax=Arthrobacter TaxID=1663 RepID=A0ABU9KJ86_9MICC|nr:amidohydrolase family protein [Arthrobacter sp. YJM1]MDP5226246.1 amidohydrolase family protein [Arthrobacter sp. YJM1]
MPSMILSNVRPWGGPAVDLEIDGALLTALRPHEGPVSPASGQEVIDGGGLLALPGFINTHAHVDKSWWHRPWVSYGGERTTQGRIAHERLERDQHGIPSVLGARTVLQEFLRHGTTAARSHVDVDLGVGLEGIRMVREASAELDDAVELTLVAFPQDGVIRRPGVLELLDRAAAEGADYIGGLDPAGIDMDPVAQLDGLFRIAVDRGVGIDIHLHDGQNLGAFQYDLIIARTIEAGLQGRVNISHGFALGDTQGTRQRDLLDGLQEAGISWTTVTPRPSPLPWEDMLRRGIGIGFGTDGIRDLWNPYGDGDILRIALDFAKQHGVRTDEEMHDVVELATKRAASFVGRGLHDLLPGARADVVLLDAENVQDALTRVPRRELVLAGGRVTTRHGEVRL